MKEEKYEETGDDVVDAVVAAAMLKVNIDELSSIMQCVMILKQEHRQLTTATDFGIKSLYESILWLQEEKRLLLEEDDENNQA